ncbi:MAG TPA: anhydro-N-acetylmuramic acid kinase, partial [Flavilitoribacter sp.]|nr:anhydro-N-acetylmuramic acid kinase [Flavilitoribacter sp.]
LAAGGEGAPLALYGDYFLFSQKEEDRFLLNIGGIANFTFLPGDADPEKSFATDTGPGNTLLDQVALSRFGVAFDRDSRFAKAGAVDRRLLDQMKEHPYFQRTNPKTTGPEMFGVEFLNDCLQKQGDIPPENLMATLTRFTAETIADAVLQVKTTFPASLYLSGGGAHNPLVVEYLRELLPDFPVYPFEKLGISGDAKEAVLFAALANETVAGEYGEGQRLGGIPLVSMGKISLPG